MRAWREPPRPDPESSLIGTLYEGYPAVAPYVVAAPDSWVFAGTGMPAGARFANLVGVKYDRVNPAYPVPRPIQVLSHSPLVCQGAASFGDSAYYTHAGGAGVFNAGTMRWVEAIFGDRPHGISVVASSFVQQVTMNVLRAFADGPAADAHLARDNLDAIHEYSGDPIGDPAALQFTGLLGQRSHRYHQQPPGPCSTSGHRASASSKTGAPPSTAPGAPAGATRGDAAIRSWYDARAGHRSWRYRHGLGVPDVAAVVADGAVGGEETRARRVQDRHLGPVVLVGPGRPDGPVVAVDVGPVVGQDQVLVPVQDRREDLLDGVLVSAGEDT